MVVQKTIDNLKERPKEERTTVAAGIAVVVVIVLMFGWGFWFIKKIQRGEEVKSFFAPRQNELTLPNALDTKAVIQAQVRDSAEQLRSLRDAAVNVPPVAEPSLEGEGFGGQEEF